MTSKRYTEEFKVEAVKQITDRLNPQPRTLPTTASEVRLYPGSSIRVFDPGNVPRVQGSLQRILRLAGETGV